MTEKIRKPHEIKMGSVNPFQDEERRLLEKYLRDGLRRTQISRLLKRSSGSISSEVKRHGGKHLYNAEKAIEIAIHKHTARGIVNYSKEVNDAKRAEIAEKIREMSAKGYSKNKMSKELTISHTTLTSIANQFDITVKALGFYENAKRVDSVEEKINNITFQVEIILDLVKQMKEKL